MTACFDVWREDGRPLKSGSLRIVVTDEWGRKDMMKKLEKLEQENGTLMVKHIGLGYLNEFKDGELKHVYTPGGGF